ncbi:outer membrane protein OmpX [Acerihabitans sp. TG2]|uniref:outer membrane protein OmpX n=1 Tax=Acerihabitans sp. TG2 TaxID=3096008 RepID=UPI002B22E78B|nr:outer membrane protein OmpX [Acerihabitans sp. TG2]MEA9390586.1 outer membrane protein OmpX [Acerihabitans sp. TG2]
MNKIACLSALACVLAVAAGSASAGESTVTAGYAQGDMQGVINKASGFNLKYRYEMDGSEPWSVISSFTYLEKNQTNNGVYQKGQYYGITAGPAYRINDWASVYGVIGLGAGKTTDNSQNGGDKQGFSDVGVAYGAGLQFNPMENVALDVSYEQSRIRSVDVGTWIAGVGYRF